MRPEFGLTQYLQSGLVSDSELSSQNVREAHDAHTASALSFSPVSVSKGRETRRMDQSLGTLKATGELLGFLILRTCETSTVKGPGRVRHSTRLKTAGSTRRTVEPKLLRVDIDRHDDGRGLKPTRRVRSDVVERGRAAMRCTRIGRRRRCRPRWKGGGKASDARRVLKLQRCWICLPTTSGRQVCGKRNRRRSLRVESTGCWSECLEVCYDIPGALTAKLARLTIRPPRLTVLGVWVRAA